MPGADELLCQDLDRLTSHVTSILLPGELKVHRDKLVQGHRASHLVDLLAQRASSLVEAYDDRNGERASEIERLSGADGSAANGVAAGADMTEFYQRLGRLKEYHRKYPGQVAEEPEFDWTAFEGDPLDERSCACISLLAFLD